MVTRHWNFNIQIWDRTQFNPSQYRHSGTNLRCTITYFIVYLVFIRQLLVQELGKSREKLTKFPPLWSTDNKGRKDISWRALFSQSYGFSSSHVWMWELEYKGGWALKNGCFWTAVLEKTLESPLDCKEIKPVNPKGNWSWIFIGTTDAEAEAPILSSPDAKNWLIGKDPDAEKDWRQEEKEKTEDKMVGWHHWLNGHEFEQALGDGERQGSLVCCCSMGSQIVWHTWAIEQQN